jgi:hypothetical protein
MLSQVSTNGVISLRNSYVNHAVESFPLQSSNAIVIAPFWADIDIENGGELYFRSSDDSNLLQEVEVVIGEGDGSDFLPITLFIATWYRVAPFGRPQEDVVSVTIQVCICVWLAVKQVAVAMKYIAKPHLTFFRICMLMLQPTHSVKNPNIHPVNTSLTCRKSTFIESSIYKEW